jgi:sugar phosphate isomerase/epimerase
MKLSASHIAWDPSEDAQAAQILKAHGFTGVEIAPSKHWESPIEATKKEIADYRAHWQKLGLTIVGTQSLLFGRKDLQLFGSQTVRRAMREYIAALVELTAELGGRSLVFGSPTNRKRGKTPVEEANEIACEFFRDLGAFAWSRGCVVCIEANPPQYDCDFITTTAEAVAFVESVNSRGVAVNGDASTIALAGEDARTVIDQAGGRLAHFHASEPDLAAPTESVTQTAAAAALKASAYPGWVSIEMRAPSSGRLQALEAAATTVARLCG